LAFKLDPRAKEIIKYGVAFAVLILVFFGGTYVLKGVLGTDYPMMVVVSQSMVPTLGVGDYIFVGKIADTKNITTGTNPDGEIIVFLKPGSTEEYIVHRAIRKVTSSGEVKYVTKGDNNLSADGVPVPPENVMGRVIGHIPIIGYFSLFIKTMRGFGLVIGFMALTFLIDYVLSPKKPVLGRFPVLSLVPLAVAPIAVASFWFISSNSTHFMLDIVAVISWYIACLIIPLAFHDDDTGAMLWLYHLVLVMLPIACDITWWSYNITPSMWWVQAGGTVSVNWFLLQEKASFATVFDSVVKTLVPGAVIFVVTLFAKRRGWEPFASWQRKLRGAPPEPPVPEPQPEAQPEPTSVEGQTKQPNTVSAGETKPENA